MTSMAVDAPTLEADACWDPEVDDRLVCVAAYDETPDVRTFVFEAPGRRLIAFEPGQFLTLGLEIGGEVVHRCYSLASSPLRPRTASISVKRVPGGVASGWLHDNLLPGGSVQASGALGSFTSTRHAAAKYLFLSGGSGVTPLMSMSRALADQGAPVDVTFLHAARTPADIVFRAELCSIARRLPGFRLAFLPEDRAGEPEWPGLTGRLSADALRLLVPDVAERTVLCCGPAPFMDAARAYCVGQGVPPERFHHESFDFETLASEDAETAASLLSTEERQEAAPSFQATFVKSNRVITIRGDEFVLKAAREAGLRLPSSCATGLCGTCKCKLVSGRVDMAHQGGIRQREIDAGMFLPCCSKPLSDLVVER